MTQFARVLSLIPHHRSRKIPTTFSQILLQVKFYSFTWSSVHVDKHRGRAVSV